MKNIKTGFTLVELVIVITILAILGTIGFVAFSSHLVGTRDTNRLSQLSTIQEGLEVYKTKKLVLPMPESEIEVRASGSIIGYEGYIGNEVLKMIEYTQVGTDPKDEQYFTYYITQDNTRFQLLAYLEDPTNRQLANFVFSQANAVNYSNRFPTLMGNKLGVLTESGTNLPLQEINSLVQSGYLDIVLTTNFYNANYTDLDSVTGTGIKLKIIKEIYDNPIKSCLTIYKSGNGSDSGEYIINPTGIEGGEIKVYCDMESDGGGWTMVMSAGSDKVIPVGTTNELSKENLLKMLAPGKLADSDINLIYSNQLRTTTTNNELINYKLFGTLVPGKLWNYTTAWQKTEHMKNGTTYKEDANYTTAQGLYNSDTYFAFCHRGAMDVWFNYNNYARYYQTTTTRPDIFLWVR